MPAKHAATLLAEGIALDALSDRVTAFNIIEHVVTQGFPALLGRLMVLSIYELGEQPDRFFERVTLSDPGGGVVTTSTTEVMAPKRTPGALPTAHRSIHALWNVELHVAGDYSALVERSDAAGGPWNPLSRRTVCALQAPYVFFAPGPSSAPESGPQQMPLKAAAEAGPR